MSRAAFLFGSGISFASNAPDVASITKSLLNGAWWQHTDERFYPRRSEEEQVSVGVARNAQEFLRLIGREIEPHLIAREKRQPNYEDIYAAVRQILDDETGEITNPLIADSLIKIKAASADFHIEIAPHIGENTFASLVSRAVDLIQSAVYQGLSPAKQPMKLKIVSDVIQKVGETDIFSLNHDLLIETQGSNAGITLLDGFGEPAGDVRIFNGAWRIGEPAARLVKLHGSINWYIVRSGEWDQFAIIKGNPDHARDGMGALLNPLSVLPMFLTGTTVKERAYGIGPFGELFSLFRTLLSRHRTLICSGYGWGDKGINARLRQWLRDAKENRIVILDMKPEEQIATTHMWWSRWEGYKDTGKVVYIPKWLSDCSLNDLSPFFDP
jgi:hypothetical protein